MTRAILHVDMDAFFASVEQRDDPSLRGKPVLVGGRGRRGVVAAASYEARVFGCRSAMPMATALRLCPNAIVVGGGYGKYSQVSREVFAILESFTPLVQPVSVDEAFLDVTGSVRLLGQPAEIARAIRERIRTELALTASVGVAPNKFLAKLASDLDKPDGLVVIEPDRVFDVLDPLPVSKLWGVGPAAEKSLHRMGLRMIGDLRRTPRAVLESKLGEWGGHLWELASGIDDRPVRTDREAKSISHERTFGENLGDPDEVRAVIAAQAEDVARRLRAHERSARTVTIKIRFGDFETVTRSRTLDHATDRTDEIYHAALALFDQWTAQFRPVRLIGVGVSQFAEEGGETGLFDAGESARRRAVDRATDAISEKFGKGSIRRARGLEPPDKPPDKTDD